PQFDSAPPGRAIPPTTEAAERLRALGYVSGSTEASPSTRAVDPKDRVDVWAFIENGIDHMARDPDAAERLFARALALDGGNGLVMKYLADLSFRRNRLAEARDRYRRALAAGFRHNDVVVNLASIAERDEHDAETRAWLGEWVRLNPRGAEPRNRLRPGEGPHGTPSA